MTNTKKTLIHFDWNPNMYAKALLKDSDSLVGAFHEFGGELRTYDDGIGPVWVYSHEFGPTFVVRAQSFENALECVYDEMDPIEADELPEAYGFDTREEFDSAIAEAEKSGEYLELAEGYTYQANATGTGIVNHGHYEGLEELTPARLESLRISLMIESYDDE